jgi:hypothetical protein
VEVFDCGFPLLCETHNPLLLVGEIGHCGGNSALNVANAVLARFFTKVLSTIGPSISLNQQETLFGHLALITPTEIQLPIVIRQLEVKRSQYDIVSRCGDNKKKVFLYSYQCVENEHHITCHCFQNEHHQMMFIRQRRPSNNEGSRRRDADPVFESGGELSLKWSAQSGIQFFVSILTGVETARNAQKLDHRNSKMLKR